MYTSLALALLAASGAVNGHMLAWSKGMYCRNGYSHEDQPNASEPVEPLIGLHYKDWFMHGACRNYPPPAGEFLDLPAGGSFTVEIAANRAFTTLSYNGTKTSDWGDGKDHPVGYGDRRIDAHFPLTELGCISSPNMHCKNEDDAAGTVFAISYNSDMGKVNMDNLVVFTVAEKTPYKRIATYHVPKQMPACPPEGCICAWGWVPNHCGQANEYMAGYRCRVTNVQPDAKPLGKPKNPVWCEGEPEKCVKGPKKMSYGYQLEGNTVNPVEDTPQADGQWKSWGYNMKLGFANGAQNDIFVSDGAHEGTATATAHATTTSKAPVPTSTAKPAPPPVPHSTSTSTSKAPSHTAKPAPPPVPHSTSTSTSKATPTPTTSARPPHAPAEPTSTSTSTSTYTEPRPSHSAPAEDPRPSHSPPSSAPAPTPTPSHSSSSESAPLPPSSSSSSEPSPELPSSLPSSPLQPPSSPVIEKPTSTPDESFAPAPSASASAPGQVDAAPSAPAPAAPKPSTAAPKPTANTTKNTAASKPTATTNAQPPKATNATSAASVPASGAANVGAAPTAAVPPKRCPVKITQRSLNSSLRRHRRHTGSMLDRFHS